jgi:hypothetical protein
MGLKGFKRCVSPLLLLDELVGCYFTSTEYTQIAKMFILVTSKVGKKSPIFIETLTLICPQKL